MERCKALPMYLSIEHSLSIALLAGFHLSEQRMSSQEEGLASRAYFSRPKANMIDPMPSGRRILDDRRIVHGEVGQSSMSSSDVVAVIGAALNLPRSGKVKPHASPACGAADVISP